MAPAGELWSTADDLCRFAVFLLDGDDRVLPATTLAEMRTPASPPGDDAWTGGYGLGLQLFRQDGRMLYGPDGAVDHLDLGSFVFTREPYGPDAPPAARPDPGGWQAF